MISSFLYGTVSVILVLDVAILALAIAIASRQKWRDDDANKKKNRQVVDVFVTRGGQAMMANAAGPANPGLGRNIAPTLPLTSQSGTLTTLTQGYPGLHNLQLYNDCRCPEDISADAFLPLGAVIQTSPACPCPPVSVPAALDWILIAATSNLSHVKMRLTITTTDMDDGTGCGCIKPCLPRVLCAFWYNFYGYERSVRDFRHCGRGVYEWEVPLVVANQVFPNTEVTFRFNPCDALTPGATYRYKVEVLSARCAVLINRKCDSTYYAIQTVPSASPLRIGQAGGRGFSCTNCNCPKTSCGCGNSKCSKCRHRKANCTCS